MMFGTSSSGKAGLGVNRGSIRETLSFKSSIGNSHLLRRLSSSSDNPELIILKRGLLVSEAIALMVRTGTDCALIQEQDESVDGFVLLKDLLELVGHGRLNGNNSIGQVMQRGMALEPDTASIEELFKRALAGRATFFVVVSSSGVITGVVSVAELIDFCLRERDLLELSADIKVESH